MKGKGDKINMSELEFTITDTPPPTTRRPGRRREANQLRQRLEESHEKRFVDTDEWFQFTVDLTGVEDKVREVNRYIDRIRAAGQMEPKIGTNVRKDYETGVIAFRGTDWVARDPQEEDEDPYAEEE